MRTRLPSWVVLDRWLVGGTLLVLVLLAALVLNVVHTRRQQQIARLVSQTNELLDAIADTRTRVVLLASADQTFLLTAADDDLRRLVPITAQALESGRRMAALAHDDPREEARIPQVLDKLQQLSDFYAGAVAGGDATAVRDRLLSGYGPRLSEEVGLQLMDMDGIGRELLADRAAASESAYRTALATGLATGLSSIALVICFVALLRRHMRKRQRDAASLRRLSDELREADRRKDRFLATLAHELRNPLAPIRTAAGILAAPQLDRGKLAWCRDVISRQVSHMAFLLEDLLDISRITQGKLTLRRRQVDLAGVVDTAVEAARPLLERKQHALEVDLQPPVPVVDVDPVRLSQAITNLLTNAAKYTDPQGRITLRGAHANGTLVLSVEDNGVGIGPESLDRIFGMFTQVDAQHRRSEGGLGIGLALTRGLVELHGGRIAAASPGPGQGSRFTITLPGVVAGAAAARPPVQPVEAPAPTAPVRHRIVVADANRDAADALGILLEMAGHEVLVAADGPAALQRILREAPDVAVLDLALPDLDGASIARQVREQGRATLLIALCEPGLADEQAVLHAGFDRLLARPVDAEALDALLQAPSATLAADPGLAAAGTAVTAANDEPPTVAA